MNMEQFMELFLTSGLRPLQLDAEFAEFEKKLTPSELTTLLMLDFYGELSMSELAKHLGAPLSTLTSMVNRLQKRKYIDRKRDIRDRRVYRVRLTSAGEEIVKRAKEKMNEMLDRVNEALTADELQHFITLALKVAKAIQHRPHQRLQKQDEAQAEARKIHIED
jgi:DNA-binding MarR family transcriptional regulator